RWLEDRELTVAATRVPKMTAGLTLLDGETHSPPFVDFMRRRADPERHELAPSLQALLERRLDALAARHRFGGVVAVPSRTWSQRESVARAAAARLGVPWYEALAYARPPETRQGERENNEQRRANVKGTIAADGVGLPDAPLLLLDDYVGSGATLAEAVRALRKDAGVKEDVVPLTIARVRWRLGAPGMVRPGESRL